MTLPDRSPVGLGTSPMSGQCTARNRASVSCVGLNAACRACVLPSATGHPLELLGIPRPLHLDFRGEAVDLTDIV